jgi:hypothetical protein
MHRFEKPLYFALLLAGSLLLAACGGGSGGGSAPAVTMSTLVTGSVSHGVPMAGATLTLKDAAGISMTTVTAADGTYTFDASGLTAPVVLVAVGTSTLVSCKDVITALATTVVNVTPWTTAICAMLSSTGKAGDLDPIHDRDRIRTMLTLVDNYTKTLLAPTLTTAGYLTSQGPISTPFATHGMGYDSIYDNLIVGETPSHVIFMADRNLPGCASNQISGCVQLANPGTQTTTNPNLCGTDITTGAPISCNAAFPLTVAPPTNAIATANADAFGCIGCVFFGPLDNFSGVASQAPLSLTHIIPASTNRGSG